HMVRQAGATHIDVRIGCPPIVAPCYFGIDMKDRKELVANGRTEEEVAQVIGAESVHYLSLPGLVSSIGIPQESLCLGCLTGRYPLDVPEERRRYQKSLTEF
ncbi:MAG TPA: amidophosphoribosyltransferase, partial [Thermoplasmata archaeon]|nr:amidophosphoribosyltransferase [Thermoplasmata archaeon]